VSPASGPLAYAFWHWKRAEVPVAEYEARQCAFQEALARSKPAGFRWGTTSRLAGAAWAAAGAPAYEDWYLVDDMAALEQLNEAAVTAGRAGPHDAIASLAANGTAGLYGLRAGTPFPGAGFAHWFAKPPGMGYPVLSSLLTPLIEPGRSALWSRRMTLGPTPEFCLQSLAPLELPSGFQVQRLVLEPVWGAAS
jgi:hypothetical protein